MKIIFHTKFYKQYNKLSSDIQALTETKLKILRIDPYDSRLKTHKLHGSFDDYWASSVNYEYRIIFKFFEKNQIWLYQIGKHDIYD